MAAKTLTYNPASTGVLLGARQTQIGVNAVAWDLNSGATKIGTISDVVLLGRIPNQSTVLLSNLRFGGTTQAGVTYALILLATETSGAFSTYATILSAATASTGGATTFQSLVPLKISLSDDRAIQYVTLALNCTSGASETVSVSTQGVVFYTTDGTAV